MYSSVIMMPTTKSNAGKNFDKKDFDDAFKEVDVIITQSPQLALETRRKLDPLAMYLSDIYSYSKFGRNSGAFGSN